jgi:hypothetical protein
MGSGRLAAMILASANAVIPVLRGIFELTLLSA